MSKRDALVLRVAAGWTVFVWATFIRNMIRSDTQSTGFKVVHSVIAVVSLGFAVALWMIAGRGRKQAGVEVDQSAAAG